MTYKNDEEKLRIVRLSLDPEWIKFLPCIHIHNKEPFHLVSIEHLLKCCILQTKPEGTVVFFPDNLNIYALTNNVKTDLSETWLKVINFNFLNKYKHWPDMPIYIRIQSENNEKVMLKCMFIMAAHKTKQCWLWSQPKMIDVRIFDMTLIYKMNRWQLHSLGWYNRDQEYITKLATELTYSDDTHPDLFLMFKTHEFHHESLRESLYHTRWKPNVQFMENIKSEKHNLSSSWTCISNFKEFLH